MRMLDQANKLRNRIQTGKKRAKTVAIVSGKGGVGKSNIILNLAIELQDIGKNVLLFDLDVGMGNIDILLGTNSKHSIVDLFKEFMAIHDIIEIGPKNLSYIAGGSGLNDIFDVTEQQLEFFYEQYNILVNDYDYIFFDLGAGVTAQSINFVLAADECIVITTPEPTSITDAYSMIKHIVRKQEDIPISVILNKYYQRREAVKILENFKKIINQYLKIQVKELGVLPHDEIVQKAVFKQVPYVLLNKNAPMTKAIKEIAYNYSDSEKEVTDVKTLTFVERLKKLLTVR